MTPILAVTVPFFALVLCGYLAARRHVLPESAIPGLNAFVLYFALPCLLFRFGFQHTHRRSAESGDAGGLPGAAGLIVFFTIATTLSKTVNLQNAAFGALVAAFPNTGFMGVPLLVALLGPAAAGPVICTMLADLFVTSSVCIAVAQATWRGRTRRARGRPACTARHGVQPVALVHRAGGRVFGGRAASCQARCSRSSTCWPMPPRRWRCSPSVRCCGGPASTSACARRCASTCRWR
jgi:hypothetical protein